MPLLCVEGGPVVFQLEVPFANIVPDRKSTQKNIYSFKF